MSLSERIMKNKTVVGCMEYENCGNPLAMLIVMIVMLIIFIELLFGIVPEIPERGV